MRIVVSEQSYMPLLAMVLFEGTWLAILTYNAKPHKKILA